MRILYLHQYFNTPAMSGGTRSYEMAKRFAAEGHDVHIITSERVSRDMPKRWRVENVDGIVVHWFPVRYDNTMPFRRRLIAFFSFAVAASLRATSVKGDVVFATSTPLTIAVPGIVAKSRLKIPMVFEVRDLWPEVPIALGALRNPVSKRLAGWLEVWAYRNSDAIVALSEGMGEGVLRRGKPATQVHIVPNCCDLTLFEVSDELGVEFRAARPGLGERPLVVYAGTLGHVNDVPYLVRVARESLQIDPEVAFLVVGDGVEGRRVDDLAEELGVHAVNFFREGSLPKEQMPAVLNAASISISLVAPIPALEANSANKFFDTLAAGRPIAINYGGWQAEVIQKHGIGLVLSRDPREAANQLSDSIRDPESLREMGQRARELAVSTYSRDQLARQLIEIIASAEVAR